MHDIGTGRNHEHPPRAAAGAFRVGIGGPVGTGKTALVAALCALLSDDLRIGVVTNDIYTTEDADTLKRRGVLDAGRIVAVETGCCPHTAIREDITANLDAIEDLEEREGPLDLVLRRERRRQPHAHVLQGAHRRAAVRARRRRRRQGAAQGRARRDPLGPARDQQDRHRATW